MKRRILAGFTLVELMVALAIAVLLGAIAVPMYQRQVASARVHRAMADIAELAAEIERWHTNGFVYPESLADAGLDAKLDPWGAPYRYTNVATANLGELRKDRNLVPINSRFDLYSAGPDGGSAPPLTASASRDDIVLANDGAFIGKAEDY